MWEKTKKFVSPLKNQKLLWLLLLVPMFYLWSSEGDETSSDYFPQIILSGKKSDTAFINTVYTDQGAFAEFNCRVIKTDVKATGKVNTRFPGTYHVHYDYEDSLGRHAATVTRTVHVMENSSAFLNGVYNAACSCTSAIPGTSASSVTSDNYIATVSGAKKNHRFELSSLKIGHEFVAVFSPVLNEDAIAFTYYSRDYNPAGQSTGTLSPAKNSFTLQTSSYQLYPDIAYGTVINCSTIFTSINTDSKKRSD